MLTCARYNNTIRNKSSKFTNQKESSVSHEIVKLDPEQVEIANSYLTNFSIEDTALELGIPASHVVDILEEKAVKRYIDNVFLDAGYRNRFKLGALLDKIIASKIEEAEETGVYTGKDLLDLLKFAHEISKPDKKVADTQINVQNNNYTDLMKELMK